MGTTERKDSHMQTKDDISSGKEKISITLLEESGYFDVPIQVNCFWALCLQSFNRQTKSFT